MITQEKQLKEIEKELADRDAARRREEALALLAEREANEAREREMAMQAAELERKRAEAAKSLEVLPMARNQFVEAMQVASKALKDYNDTLLHIDDLHESAGLKFDPTPAEVALAVALLRAGVRTIGVQAPWDIDQAVKQYAMRLWPEDIDRSELHAYVKKQRLDADAQLAGILDGSLAQAIRSERAEREAIRNGAADARGAAEREYARLLNFYNGTQDKKRYREALDAAELAAIELTIGPAGARKESANRAAARDQQEKAATSRRAVA